MKWQHIELSEVSICTSHRDDLVVDGERKEKNERIIHHGNVLRLFQIFCWNPC